MGDNVGERLLDHEEALENYFDSLLSSLDPPAIKQSEVPKRIALVPQKDNGPVLHQINPSVIARRVEAERVEAERVEAERVEAERVEAERVEAERVDVEKVDVRQVKVGDEVPGWAGKEFNALVCKVGHVNLTFPSSAISGELEFNNELKAVAGQPDWVLGLKMVGASFVAVVDLGSLLLNQPVRDIKTNPYKKIILLENTRWGFALDSVSSEIEVVTDQVSWRDNSASQQWLRGVDSLRKWAIIDPAKIFFRDK